MKHYYCLVSGLPDLEQTALPADCSLSRCKEWLLPQLTPTHRRLASTLYYASDNSRLLSLCVANIFGDGADNRHIEETDNGAGMLSDSELLQIIDSVRNDEPVSQTVPSYMLRFVRMCLEGQVAREGAEGVLSALCHEQMALCGNDFVASWHALCRDLANVSVALTARKYGFDAAPHLVGDGAVVKALLTSSASDFGLSSSLFGVDRIVSAFSSSVGPLEKERVIDAVKWQWLDEAVFMYHFSIERVFAFLAGVQMLERWTRLDAQRGRTLLMDTVEELRAGVLNSAENSVLNV